MKSVWTILLNWNGKSQTLACLRTLQTLQTPGLDHTVIVVDNNSTDGSVDAIKKSFRHVQILEQSENLGFAQGNNIGIEFARRRGAEYFWLLNNDTEVDPLSLDALIVAQKNFGSGIYGSKIYFSPGFEFHKERYKKSERGKVLWYAGGEIDWNNMYALHRGVDEVDHGQYDAPEETAFVTGCSFFLSREVIQKTGLLDTRYYLYLEDTDYCIRAKNAGFVLMYVPTSRIWHKNAGSTAKPGHGLHEYYMTRNRLLFGFSYASWRTKLALLRESMRMAASGTQIQKQAIRDYYFHKFGNRYQWTIQ